MFAVIGTVDNYTILPSPVLDDADPKGYRIEQRLQVTLKLAANERQQYTVEFRLGDESQAPSTDLLTKWLESGELVQAYCAGLAARPFVHSKEKTYQRRGRAVQIGDQTAELDAFVVFAGSAMAVARTWLAARGAGQAGPRRLQAQPARLPRSAQRRSCRADGGAAGGAGAPDAGTARPGGGREGCRW